MAQLMIHYLAGERLIDEVLSGMGSGEGLLPRFRLGNLLPDAYRSAVPDRALRRRTHFITDIEGGGRCSDFSRFCAMFPDRIPDDGLYLGYYMHLVEDACFRVFWHSQGLGSRVRSSEDISYLHRDYHILNRSIVSEYGLANRVVPIAGLDAEPINAIYPFAQERLLTSFAEHFADGTEGEPAYFTPELARRFIGFAMPVCRGALEYTLRTKKPLDGKRLSW